MTGAVNITGSEQVRILLRPGKRKVFHVKKIEAHELESLIGAEHSIVQGTLTITTLTLTSGFKLVGTAACINPDDFNRVLGVQIARGKAFDKLWELEAYHRMRAAELAEDPPVDDVNDAEKTQPNPPPED